MFDIIIKGGEVVDGTGASPFSADVGIRDGRIGAVGSLETKAAQVINARGLLVAPGFIDMHSHSDLALLLNPRAESKIRQGITTEVIGNCGSSPAPAKEETLDLLKAELDIESLQLHWDWLSMGEYLKRLEKQGIALNIVPLIGHGTIRTAVMGFENRAPNDAEMKEIKELIRQAMEEGAFGLSTGLIYAPGSYAETDELIELSRVVAGYNGIYCSHIRGEGDTLLVAVEEAIRIGREAGLRVQLSHHKAVGKKNWGKVKESLEMIDSARESGLDVNADQYPYVATSNALSDALPSWMHEGGKESMLGRLKDPTVRERIRKEMKIREGYWEDTRIAYCETHKECEGKSIQEIAGLRKVDPFTATFDLLEEEKAVVQIVRFGLSEDDVRTVMKHPAVMIGSDGSALAIYGALSRGKPHPRNYGTFPRVLGKYVREEGVVSMEEAIRKMTALPAQKLGLRDRGLIREGMFADITIFDPERVRDKATFTDPHQYPVGIEYVLVGGTPVIEKGEHTERLHGRVLERGN